jgi:hypothetical protein
VYRRRLVEIQGATLDIRRLFESSRLRFSLGCARDDREDDVAFCFRALQTGVREQLRNFGIQKSGQSHSNSVKNATIDSMLSTARYSCCQAGGE